MTMVTNGNMHSQLKCLTIDFYCSFFSSLSLTTAVNIALGIQVHQSTTRDKQPHSVPARRMVSLVSGQEKRAVIISAGCIRAVIIPVRV